MAVAKSRVASILPLIRAWQDALHVWELEYDELCPNGEYPDGEDLGVNWPTDWKHGNGPCGNNIDCHNDYWDCNVIQQVNDVCAVVIGCTHRYDNGTVTGEWDEFDIGLSSIHEVESVRNRITCEAQGPKSNKLCAAIGTLVDEGDWNVYLLN